MEKHQRDNNKPQREQGWLGIEKIDTDYKQQNWKVWLNFLNSFNNDVAPSSPENKRLQVNTGQKTSHCSTQCTSQENWQMLLTSKYQLDLKLKVDWK